MSIDHTLVDTGDTPNTDRPEVKIKLDRTPNAIWIMPEGYGDSSSADGHGSPVGIEYYNGHLRLIVYKDINEQDPEIIDLEDARESNRSDDE